MKIAGVSAPRLASRFRQEASEPGEEASLKNPDRQRSRRSRHETETSACRGEWRREAHRPRKRERPSVCRRERARGERPLPQIGSGSVKTSGAFFVFRASAKRKRREEAAAIAKT